MRFFYSPKFLRSFAKLPEGIQNEFRRREAIFRKDLFDSRLRTHKLKGKNEWAFLITYKMRVILIFERKNILFVNIGDHSVYRNK